MSSDPDSTYWTDQPPQWDSKNRKYYWEGCKLRAGEPRAVRMYLKFPEDFDSDGNPLPDLRPPSSGLDQSLAPRTTQPTHQDSYIFNEPQQLATYSSSPNYGIYYGSQNSTSSGYDPNEPVSGAQASPASRYEVSGAYGDNASMTVQAGAPPSASSLSGGSRLPVRDSGFDNPQNSSRIDHAASSTSGTESQGQIGYTATRPSQGGAFGVPYQSGYNVGPVHLSAGGSMPPPSTTRAAIRQDQSRSTSGRHRRPPQDDHQDDSGSGAFAQMKLSESSSSHRRDRRYHTESSHGSRRHRPRPSYSDDITAYQGSSDNITHASQRGGYQTPQIGNTQPITEVGFSTMGGDVGGGPSSFSAPSDYGIGSAYKTSADTPKMTPVRVKQKAIDQAPRIFKPRNSKYLDPGLRVCPSSSFQPGKIIKILWFEPKGTKIRGAGGSRLTNVETVTVEDAKNEVWSGFRRFIIILNNEGHCTCVPIYSYGNQGCTKPGCKASQHGIIYENQPGNGPLLMENEPDLGFEAIRATTTTGESITATSRVNYSKIVTIEHNARVMFVGEVLPEDWHIAKAAVRSFFS